MSKIKAGDIVKVMAGGQKGKDGKVVKVKDGKVYIEKVNLKTRHIRPSQLNPRGGKKDIHVGIDISNVVLLVDGKPAKVGFKTTDGKKVRVVRKTGKEIK
ncbi:MAG: 50S ribosomal protein L24 [Candidatus Nomurabacteria bacterium]|jgi:large subunit ribosomal protein L24|nr:50S ribosomal protein L24 [Candidatus Nomurabacteria bacterium]